eukprot:Awhi_evm1s11853
MNFDESEEKVLALQGTSRKNERQKSTVVCEGCGIRGHRLSTCRLKDVDCDHCGGKGHVRRYCKERIEEIFSSPEFNDFAVDSGANKHVSRWGFDFEPSSLKRVRNHYLYRGKCTLVPGAARVLAVSQLVDNDYKCEFDKEGATLSKGRRVLRAVRKNGLYKLKKPDIEFLHYSEKNQCYLAKGKKKEMSEEHKNAATKVKREKVLLKKKLYSTIRDELKEKENKEDVQECGSVLSKRKLPRRYVREIRKQAAEALKKICTDSDANMKFLLTEGGTEFTSKLFKEVASANNVEHKFCAPHTPEHRGKIERSMGLVFSGVKAALEESGIAKKPEIEKIYKFGSKCWFHHKESGKLIKKACSGRLLCIDEDYVGGDTWVILNMESGRLVRSRNFEANDEYVTQAEIEVLKEQINEVEDSSDEEGESNSENEDDNGNENENEHENANAYENEDGNRNSNVRNHIIDNKTLNIKDTCRVRFKDHGWFNGEITRTRVNTGKGRNRYCDIEENNESHQGKKRYYDVTFEDGERQYLLTGNKDLEGISEAQYLAEQSDEESNEESGSQGESSQEEESEEWENDGPVEENGSQEEENNVGLMSNCYNLPKKLTDIEILPDRIEWMEAVLQSLWDNNTYRIVKVSDLPKVSILLSTKYIFDIKRDENGQPIRRKVRSVVEGQHARKGFEYERTSSPLKRGWEIKQMDVKTAFLEGEMDKPVYCSLPEWLRLIGVELPKDSIGILVKKS